MKNPPPLTITIPPAWAGRSIKSILYNYFYLSRGQITALKKNNGIFLDEKPVYVTHPVTGNEILSLYIAPIKQTFQPEDIPLKINYEDPDLVIIDKPVGLLIHPVRYHPTGTLANALTFHWQMHNEKASFHPIHRLDKTTSGLVLVAKNPWSHQQLSRQIGHKTARAGINRMYLAICHGSPDKTSGKISAPIKRSAVGIKREVSEDGKPALTRFRVLQKYKGFSLLAIKLFTGRTHQIRVHLSYLGHPLLGDNLYGGADSLIIRPALHAIRIGFIHPRSKKKIKATSSLPPDFSNLIITR